VAAALCLGASIVLHPVIALPFCLAFGGILIKDLSRDQLKSIVSGVVILLICVGYIAFLGLGPSSTPSQPQILLSELSVNIFVTNILKYFREDTFGYGFVLLTIPIFAILVSKKSSQSLLLFYPWFLGCILIDGLFGHTHWTARFQKSFNLIGIWILSIGLAQRLWSVFWEGLITSFPSWNRKIVLAAQVAGIGGLAVFWFLAAGPNSTVLPSPIFSSHGAIRMGRFIEENVPANALIYFKRLYTDANGNNWDNLNMLRGDSSRNSVQGRIFDHHIKVGHINSREPVNACFDLSASAKMAECFKGFGVNYLLLDMGPGKLTWDPKDSSLMLEHQVAGIFLFKFRL
jgi:hypothetical protein